MDGVGAVSSRVWTVPNALSFFRLALVPVFLWFVIVGEDALALAVLVVSSITDFLDGWLARKLNQVSRLGQLLDPAADRLYIFAALVGLDVRDLHEQPETVHETLMCLLKTREDSARMTREVTERLLGRVA